MGKNSRAKKDKNAPKKAMSAFFCFQKERRETLKKEQPELENKDLILQMSKEWNSMTDEKKKKYNDMAAKEKERYKKEMKEYEKKKGEDEKEDEEDNKKKKKVNKKSKNKKGGKKRKSSSDLDDESGDSESGSDLPNDSELSGGSSDNSD